MLLEVLERVFVHPDNHKPTIMMRQLLFAFASLLTRKAAAYKCIDFLVPMSLEAPSLQPNFAPFNNQLEAVDFLSNITASNAADLIPPYGESRNVDVNITLAVQYCTPDSASFHSCVDAPTQSTGNNVQILSSGISFDHSYWFFGGPHSQYNYVKAATEIGYSTLSYDRIGTGKSTKANPYTLQQTGVHVEILKTLTSHLRDGNLSMYAKQPIPKPAKIVHVGHSYGSTYTAMLARMYPSITDGIVLTGFGTNASWQRDWQIGQGMHIASEQDPHRFREYNSTGFVTWPDTVALQYLFFHYPRFSLEVLTETERNKWPYGIGEIVPPVGAEVAAHYTGPVLVCFSFASSQTDGA